MEMLPSQSASIILNEVVACCTNNVGHLDGCTDRFQMAFRNVEVNRGGFQVGVPEQQLTIGKSAPLSSK